MKILFIYLFKFADIHLHLFFQTNKVQSSTPIIINLNIVNRDRYNAFIFQYEVNKLSFNIKLVDEQHFQ